MYLYVRIDMCYRIKWFDKQLKQDPSPGDDTRTAESAPNRVGIVEKVRNDEQTAHRMVDLISS